MATKPRITVTFEDVGGTFRRFVDQAPKEARKRISTQVLATVASLERRMKAGAPVGPDDAHIRDAITFKHRGLNGSVGFLAEDFGAMSAGDGSTATMADVGLYNEYNPNKQPFMVPAAESESSDWQRRMKEALVSMERALQFGGGR